MDSVTTPIYIIIGSILGIISALVLTILHLPQFVSVIRSFSKWLHSWLRERPKRFNRWRWWRQYRTSWQMVSYEDIQVIYNERFYRIKLPIVIKYKNNNNRYEASFDVDDIRVLVYHKGSGWEKYPYQLFGDSSSPKGLYRLPPSEEKELTYIFEREMPASPILGSVASCKIISENYGAISTHEVSAGGKLKREGKVNFETNIIWKSRDDKKEEPKTE